MADPITQDEIEGLGLDIETISAVVESPELTTLTKNGQTIKTLNGQLNDLGFLPSIAYAGSILFTISDNRKTIERSGLLYAPIPTLLPFTTSGTWVGDDEDNFTLILSVSAALDNAFTALNTFEADTDNVGAKGIEVNDIEDLVLTYFRATGGAIEIGEQLAFPANVDEKRGLKLWAGESSDDFYTINSRSVGSSPFIESFVYESGVSVGRSFIFTKIGFELFGDDGATLAMSGGDLVFGSDDTLGNFVIDDSEVDAENFIVKAGIMRGEAFADQISAQAFYTALSRSQIDGDVVNIVSGGINQMHEYNDEADSEGGLYKAGGYYNQSITDIGSGGLKINSMQGALDYIIGESQKRTIAAWVTFNGKTGAIYDEFNVSSIAVQGNDSDYIISLTDTLTGATSAGKYPSVTGSANVENDGKSAAFGLHQDWETELTDNAVRVVYKKDNGDFITGNNRPEYVTIQIFATYEADQ